jgi:hypothetical protein
MKNGADKKATFDRVHFEVVLFLSFAGPMLQVTAYIDVVYLHQAKFREAYAAESAS